MQEVNRSAELIPVQEKYALTIREASEYFSIGIKKMRRLSVKNFYTICLNSLLSKYLSLLILLVKNIHHGIQFFFSNFQ